MNYLIARVSEPEQRKSLPAQRKKIFDYADKAKWEENTDFLYIEFDETAFKEDRKDFRKLVIEPLKTEIETSILVFDKIDRFSRDSSSDEKTILTKMWKSGKIEMHFPSDNLYIHKDSPAADIFRLDIGISLAAYYSSAIRDNVKRRFDQMLNDGIWVGKAPIGYTNFQVLKEDGKLFKGIKIDPDRSPHIVKAFELRATGMPYRAIAKQMKGLGLVSNTKHLKPISSSQWERILADPFYIGTMRFQGVKYAHHYPQFLDKSLWEDVQDVRLNRSKSRTKYSSKPYLFRKLSCHECGYSISFDGPKGKGKNTYGKCTEHGGKHNAEWINEKILYEQVSDLLKKIEIPTSKIPQLLERIEKTYSSDQKYIADVKTKLQKEYDKLDAELEELFKDRKQFLSRADVFERMVKKIEIRQKEIKDELLDRNDDDEKFTLGAKSIIDVCNRASELFNSESTSLEQKRKLLDYLLSNATLEGKKLHLTVKNPIEEVLNMQKAQDWCTRQDSNL
jgi:site-specific DNA recombinase